MTTHVNFTACRRAAVKASWEVVYYDTQKQFLIDQGIWNDLLAHDGSNPFGEEARRNRSIRQLLLSDGMSESFKVMIVKKQGEPATPAFSGRARLIPEKYKQSIVKKGCSE